MADYVDTNLRRLHLPAGQKAFFNHLFELLKFHTKMFGHAQGRHGALEFIYGI